MHRKDSVFGTNDVFVNTAVIGAHASYRAEGFRQKDIKFYIEMFSNWIDTIFPDFSLMIHNTQVMRYLDQMVTEGFAKQVSRTQQKRYKLTRTGLISVLEKLSRRRPSFPLEHFYFVYHFLSSYREPLMAMIQSEGKEFPPALRIELESLFDTRRLLADQLAFVELEHKKLSQRIEDSKQVVSMIKKMRKSKASTEDIIEKITELVPYDLNSQKKMTDFYQELPPALRDWILDHSLESRTNQIWTPLLNSLSTHADVLKKLS